MANSLRRNLIRKDAEKVLNEVMQSRGMVNVIHYSCESFYDRKDGSSPRITSIAVQNFNNAQTYSFSIHQFAEVKGASAEELEADYDKFEKEMLSAFYEFVEKHNNHKWIHWNMRDINYGFQAIEHRCRVVKGKPVKIPENNLFDLPRLLFDIYGHTYSPHPRFEKLMDINKITRKDFLTGKEEAKAFENREYVKLHQSTLRKVDVLSSFADRAWKKELKTNSKWRDIYGNSIVAFVEIVTDHWLYKVLGFIGIIATLLGLVFGIIPFIK